jgi:hypothetical protein
MFAGKAKSLPYSGAPVSFVTLVPVANVKTLLSVIYEFLIN